MSNVAPNIEKIDEILQKTIHSINDSKEEMIDIVEQSRINVERNKKELEKIKDKVEEVIEEVDSLEVKERKSRVYLSNVNKNFNVYSEDELREAYDRANEIRVELLIKREEEKNLIERRKEQEMSLKFAMRVYNKSEKAWKSVNVVNEYLKGNLDEILFTVDHLNKKQVLGIKIIEAQEEERQRISRDMHDGPAQAMTHMLVKAELCEKLMEIDKERFKDELQNLKGIARDTLKDIRKTIYELRPMALDDLGLIPTLERYIDNFIDYTEIKVKLDVFGDIISLNSAIEIAVFRIVQEALSNINKHSNSTEAKVIVEFSPTRFNLAIIDKGIGFNAEEVHKNGIDRTKGYGLLTMKERVELLGGDLQMKSVPGEGTKINVCIILPEEEY